MSDKTMPITGGCLCGAVRFEATEPPSWVGQQNLSKLIIREGLGRPYAGGARDG